MNSLTSTASSQLFTFSVVLVLLISSVLPSAFADSASCTSDQIQATPCRCCKMDCWYAVAQSATHELGHIPGQAGEREALATLKLIRACMVEECASLCSASVPRPFRPAIDASMA
ncbi:Protein F17C11.2 [Aphelenchoides avenae]|nr:Protein F17C11.2 [Aphelenchus avenae]